MFLRVVGTGHAAQVDPYRGRRRRRPGDGQETAHAALGGASLRWHYPVQVLGSTCAGTCGVAARPLSPAVPSSPALAGRTYPDRTRRAASAQQAALDDRADRRAPRGRPAGGPGAQTNTRPAPQRRVQTAGDVTGACHGSSGPGVIVVVASTSLSGSVSSQYCSERSVKSCDALDDRVVAGDVIGVLDQGAAGVRGELGADQLEVVGGDPERVDDPAVPAGEPGAGGDGGRAGRAARRRGCRPWSSTARRGRWRP